MREASAIPLRTLIRPAVEHLAAKYGAAGGAPAEAMMGAIGLQESLFQARDQLEMQNGILVAGRPGPAMGFWQFEKGGGVTGVMRHPSSRKAAQDLVTASGLPFDADAIWRFLGTVEGDELAAAFARLLLLTDPSPLPDAVPESEEEAWLYYLRNWRPGKPHKQFWNKNWTAALEAVRLAGAPAAPPAPRPPSVLLGQAPPSVLAPGALGATVVLPPTVATLPPPGQGLPSGLGDAAGLRERLEKVEKGMSAIAESLRRLGF